MCIENVVINASMEIYLKGVFVIHFYLLNPKIVGMLIKMSFQIFLALIWKTDTHFEVTKTQRAQRHVLFKMNRQTRCSIHLICLRE